MPTVKLLLPLTLTPTLKTEGIDWSVSAASFESVNSSNSVNFSGSVNRSLAAMLSLRGAGWDNVDLAPFRVSHSFTGVPRL